MADEEEQPTHEFDFCFLGGPGELYYQPCVSCSCGWRSGRVETFEEAGAMLDQHLIEVEGRIAIKLLT